MIALKVGSVLQLILVKNRKRLFDGQIKRSTTIRIVFLCSFIRNS